MRDSARVCVRTCVFLSGKRENSEDDVGLFKVLPKPVQSLDVTIRLTTAFIASHVSAGACYQRTINFLT